MEKVQIEDVEESLLYLSNIGALKLDGGFMVLYSAMAIHRLKDMKLRYKQDDYRMLDEFYKQKIQLVHIVGEFAIMMVIYVIIYTLIWVGNYLYWKHTIKKINEELKDYQKDEV